MVFLALPATAQIPQTINYQGSLKQEPDKTPVDGTVNMQFALYETLTGGTALWTESHPTVPVADGIYSVILGSSVPLDLDFDMLYYLQSPLEQQRLNHASHSPVCHTRTGPQWWMALP